VIRDPIRAAVICVAALLVAPSVGAQVTTDRGASILIFPKVIADASADTTLQVVNLSDNNINVQCAYVDGTSGSWQSTGFTLTLESQRPVHWTAARGRTAGPGEPPLDVPAAPASFRGELLCVQVDGTGAPFGGNELAGQATVSQLARGDVGAYTAFGLRGSGLNDGDDILCIGDAPSDNCFLGVGEYGGCPDEWILSVPAEGTSETQLSPGSRLSSRMTVVPCSQNLRDGTPSSVAIEIAVFNELGQQFTGGVSVSCWADLSLADVGGQIFDRDMLGTDYAEARLRPADGSGGFLLIAETTRATGDASVVASTASVNPQHRGISVASDVIVLPPASPVP
jgi:hypothetical protein